MTGRGTGVRKLRETDQLCFAGDEEIAGVLAGLQALESPKDRAGMARFGICVDQALGISVSTLRRLAKPLRGRHELAVELWASGIHEARILATIIADPQSFTPELAQGWVQDLNSWDLCDQFCMNLMRNTDMAWDKAFSWCRADPPFIKRAGFSLMATLAVKDKGAWDAQFHRCLAEVGRASGDSRNFVKKAVNWTLRQIGKRNAALHRDALILAQDLANSEVPTARWIGRNAVRELESQAVLAKLER